MTKMVERIEEGERMEGIAKPQGGVKRMKRLRYLNSIRPINAHGLEVDCMTLTINIGAGMINYEPHILYKAKQVFGIEYTGEHMGVL